MIENTFKTVKNAPKEKNVRSLNVSISIWHNILEKFNRVCKSLQGIEMSISSAVLLLRDLNKLMDRYESTGYEKAARELKSLTLMTKIYR